MRNLFVVFTGTLFLVLGLGVIYTWASGDNHCSPLDTTAYVVGFTVFALGFVVSLMALKNNR